MSQSLNYYRVNSKINVSISQLIQWLNPHLSTQIISKKYKDKILECANQLPDFLTSQVVAYECPLSGKERWGDFAFIFQTVARRKKVFPSTPLWQGVSRLYKHWNETNSGFVRDFWLEFDTGSAPCERPPPNVMINLQEGYGKKFDLVSDLHFWLTGSQKSFPVDWRLFMQSGIEVKSLSYMIGRAEVFSFSFTPHQRFSSSELQAFFHAIGHPGVHPLFYRLFKKKPHFLSHFTCKCDAKIKPHFEWAIRPEQLAPGQNWFEIFDFLESEGLVKKDLIDDLLSWCGHAWETKEYSEDKFLLIRRVGRIKLLFPPNGDVVAKAYPGAYVFAESEVG